MKWIKKLLKFMSYNNGMSLDDGRRVRIKKVDIGDWSMDFGHTVTIDVGIPIENILDFQAWIRNDADNLYTNLCYSDTFNMSTSNPTSITLTRTMVFDSPDYSAKFYNRGYVLIWYLE